MKPIIAILMLACVSAFAQTVSGPSSTTTNSIPTWQGGSGKARLKDNSGLTWDGTNLVANGVTLGSGGDQVWTNDGTYYRLADETNSTHRFDLQITDAGANLNITNPTNSGSGASFYFDPAFAGFDSYLKDELNRTWSATLDNGVTDGTNGHPALTLYRGGADNLFTLLDPSQGSFQEPYRFDTVNTIAATDPVVNFANHATNVATIKGDGSVSAVGGFASTATTTAVTISPTGWTNTFGVNAVVYYDGTNVTSIVKNNANAPVYTNTAPLSGGSILLQPSGAVILSGTGVNGRAAPF